MLAGRDIAVAGASLAAHAIKAGLVDEYHLIISPILVGGGKQSLPNHVLLRLDLLAERRLSRLRSLGAGTVLLLSDTERLRSAEGNAALTAIVNISRSARARSEVSAVTER